MTAYHSLRRHSLTHLTRHFSTATKTQIPTLYSPTDAAPTTALQLLSWGRGASGQLGGGIEEIRLYPSPVANLAAPSSFTLSPTPGKLPTPKAGNDVMEVGISCGLFHSSLGGLHSVSLTTLGEVYTWGYGGFGALGHSVYTRELFPRFVEGSWSGRIQHVSTSGTHTAAITESGELILGVEMKGMVDWALVPIGAQMRVVD